MKINNFKVEAGHAFIIAEIGNNHNGSFQLAIEMIDKAIEAGALGCGISGSGPSVFALTKGSEIAKKVAHEMRKVLITHNIEIHCYISKINPNGIKIISSK